jgi:hypothetical protein
MQIYVCGHIQFRTPIREAKFCGVSLSAFNKLHCAPGYEVCVILLQH